MDRPLDKKNAIVTGGAGGIGKVFARALAEAGASVVVTDLDLSGAQAVVGQLTADGHTATAAPLDVTEPDSARAAVEVAQSAYGGVDILINSAALMAEIPLGPLSEFPLDWWDRVIAVNLKGPLVCTQAVVASMTERGGGRIVNMVSAGAFQPSGVYGVSKYALTGLTMNLASQLGAGGITVNAIAPGLVANDAGYRALPAGEYREMIHSVIPLKTHLEGPPEDLLGLMMLLVCSNGSWITGQTICADGGWIMRY